MPRSRRLPAPREKKSTALQQLRSELEVAQGKASEAQEAAEELRQQLQQEKVSRFEVEHLLELQRESHRPCVGETPS